MVTEWVKAPRKKQVVIKGKFVNILNIAWKIWNNGKYMQLPNSFVTKPLFIIPSTYFVWNNKSVQPKYNGKEIV